MAEAEPRTAYHDARGASVRSLLAEIGFGGKDTPGRGAT